MKRTCAALVACLVCLMAVVSVARAGDGPAGHWEGAIDVLGSPLGIDVDLADAGAGAWKGDISIPAQNARDLPLEAITVEGREVSFAIAGVPGDPTFVGLLSEDGLTIAGDFTQAEQTMPFKLTRAKPAAAAAVDALAGFGEWVDKTRADWKVPGVSVAVVKGDQVVFVGGFGLRDVDGKKPVTADTLFPIGSSTKAFTTFVLGTLVDEGKLEWDAPVMRYMPEFRLHDDVASDRISARDLVTHRSGLPRHDLLWYNNSAAPREELVRRLRYLEPSKDFRTDFQYNNLMFLTAGYLTERLTAGPWEQAVRLRVLEPLGMTRSNFAVSLSQSDADHALGYEERDDAVVRMTFREITNMGPAGSINSSAAEMATWAALHLGDGTWRGTRLIKAATLADLHAPRMAYGTGPTAESPEVVPLGYALGWFTDVYRGHLRVHHGGNIDGFSALVVLLPQDGMGVVVLANMNGSGLPGMIARGAIDRVLGLELTDWSGRALAKRAIAKKALDDAKKNKNLARKEGTSPSHALAEYAGEYANDGYGTLYVDLEGGALRVRYNGIPGPLEHWHYDVFSVGKDPTDHALEDVKVQFRTGLDGEIDGLLVPLEPSVGPIVFARQPDPELADAAYLKKFEGVYELSGEPISITLTGKTLTAIIPAQPVYELLPTRHDSFNLKGLTGYSVKFLKDEQGNITAAQFNQPEGVFTAKRVDEKGGKRD